MKRSLRDAYLKTFVTLAIALRWQTYLRSVICQSEGYSEQITETARKAVNFVGDSFLTRDDVNDNRARVALHELLSASSEDIARAERCLQEVGFPPPCVQLALLCSSSLDIQNVWRDTTDALTIMSEILTVRLIEVASALQNANELESAYASLKERLLASGDTSERAEELVSAVRREISARLRSMNML